MKEIFYSSGEVIFNEGDYGDSFFYIEKGTVGVYTDYNKENQLKLTDLGPGDYFGEMAVIESFPRSSTVVAEDAVKVFEIPADKLNDYFAEAPDKIIAIINHLGKRIKELSVDYGDAKALLKELEGSEVDKSSESVLSKIKKFIAFYNTGKAVLDKPSAEAVRVEDIKDNSSTVMETYKKGTIIFKQGESGECMYALHGGKVVIYSDYGSAEQTKLTELLPGDFFGEMGMLAKEDRSATAVAEEDNTYVEIITTDKLEDLFKENPVEVDMILRFVSHRLRRLTEDFLNVCKKISEIS